MNYAAKYTVWAEIEHDDLLEHVKDVIDEDSPPSTSFDEWMSGQHLPSMLEEMLESVGVGYVCTGHIDQDAWGEFIANKYYEDCC